MKQKLTKPRVEKWWALQFPEQGFYDFYFRKNDAKEAHAREDGKFLGARIVRVEVREIPRKSR